jgi:hypothetical protein
MGFLFAYYVLRPLLWAIQAGIVLALLGVVGAVIFRRRASQPAPTPSPTSRQVVRGRGSRNGGGGGDAAGPASP